MKFNSTIDAYFDGIFGPDTNYGAALYVHHGPFYNGPGKAFLYRGLGNFDVSSLAGQSIAGARLLRYMTDITGPAFGAHIYRCTRPSSWTEGGVTWNKYDGVNAWTSAGGDFDLVTPLPVGYVEAQALGWFTISGLGDFVVDALASRGGIVSLLLKADAEAPGFSTEVGWGAKEGYSYPRWYLEVDLALPAEPGRSAGSGECGLLAGSRGVRPRAGRLGVSPVGGVVPRRPVPSLMEVTG